MRTLFLVIGFAFLSVQENPIPCGREDDQARPEELVACACYVAKDPCAEGETHACRSYCRKDTCSCCQP